MPAPYGLDVRKNRLESYLAGILPDGPSELDKAMHYAVLSGGKRFRPLLTLAAGLWFKTSEDSLLPFAAAVELVHNYSLIHDDLPCLDNDEVRRGLPTCHRKFGEDIALLAGDGLLTLAFELMASAPLKGCEERTCRALAYLGKASGREGMIGGQLLDIRLDEDSLDQPALVEVMLKKTGALITAAVVIGGIVSGASAAEEKALEEYGRHLGLAFQIRDDRQDAEQDSQRKGPFRPNAANLWGLREADKRLHDHVRQARSSLNKAGILSEELFHLADRLLHRDEGIK